MLLCDKRVGRRTSPVCRVEPTVSGGIVPCHVRPGFLTVDHGAHSPSPGRVRENGVFLGSGCKLRLVNVVKDKLRFMRYIGKCLSGTNHTIP
jgi:hypothetical protein